MTMERKNLVRVFNYAGVRLPDPDITLSPDEVLEFLAATGRPELTGAEITGPETEGEYLVYSLVRRTGTKGALAASAVTSRAPGKPTRTQSRSRKQQATQARCERLMARIERSSQRVEALAVAGSLAGAFGTLALNRGAHPVVLEAEHNLWIA